MHNAMKFEKNLGRSDRILRLVFSAIVIILFFLDVINGTLAAALLSLAVVLAVTALFSFCPIYRAFRLNSRGNSSSSYK